MARRLEEPAGGSPREGADGPQPPHACPELASFPRIPDRAAASRTRPEARRCRVRKIPPLSPPGPSSGPPLAMMPLGPLAIMVSEDPLTIMMPEGQLTIMMPETPLNMMP